MKGLVQMKKSTERQKKIGGVVHQFLHLNRLHRSMVEAEISQLGIHCSQHHMLTLISKNKSICQKEIAQQLEISSAAVAVTLNKLESSGLVTRTQSFDDARMNHISITDKGSDLLKTTKKALDVVDAKWFDGLSDEEMEAFSATLSKMIDNLKSLASEKE